MMEQPNDFLLVANDICSANGLTFRQPLGRGSFKQAYLVEEENNGNIALKIITDPNPSPRTNREIESLAKCQHPSIARLKYVGTHMYEGVQYQYLLEEYLSGGTLSERIDNSPGGLDEPQVWHIAVELIDALRHLHQLGLVHRDIKPDNILFREDLSTPVLVDFGCVKDLSASSLTGTWLPRGPGTPYFASPEQLTNNKPLTNWRSDQFSLGVTLFYSRFKAHPYQHESEQLFAAETVNRVAKFGSRRSDFGQLLANTILLPIEIMTAPWPAERFRYPSNLASAWSAT